MWILGIVNSVDSSAALFSDNKLIAAMQEERFNRIKMTDEFPINSINYVLGEAGISLKDVDVVTYGWSKSVQEDYVLRSLIKRAMEASLNNPSAADIIDERVKVCLKNDSERREKFKKKMNELGWRKAIHTYYHHVTHAAYAFYTSPFERSLVITADGRGDFKSITVSIGNGKDLEEVGHRTLLDSLGYFYSIVTRYLGFRPVRHEGKVTGLAAYGNPDKCLHLMKEMIDIKDNEIVSNIGKYYKPFDSDLLPAVYDDFSQFSKEDIAAAAQKHLEDVFVKYIKFFVDKYKIGDVCLSGGVFQNVKLNQRIREIPGIYRIHIPPNVGDSGLSVGSCLLYLNGKDCKSELSGRCEIPNAYLGLSFSDREVEETLKKYPVRFYKSEDKVAEVANYIHQDKVIGWFQGKMEWGQRALGNRSILYHSKDQSINDWLNKRLNRTEFMPFAPVTANDIAKKCYKDWHEDHIFSKFMLMTYNCTEEFIKNSPAVVHIDGTARPQIIFEEDNPHYYRLAKKCYDEFGYMSLLNTSFNMHEEPIVNTPDDALKTLVEYKVIDVLVVENYIITRA